MIHLRHLVLLLGFSASSVFAETLVVTSPDKRIKVSLANTESGLRYRLERDGKLILADSSLGIAIDQDRLGGSEMALLSHITKSVRDQYNLVAGPHKTLADHYEFLAAEFAGKGEPQKFLNIHLRVYDQGVALRYELPQKNPFDEFSIQ